MTGLHADPDVLGLLQAAKAGPEDDGPCLALSDWLEERGDPARAEFLRLQLLLAPGSSLESERRVSAQQRAQELLDRFGGGWLGPLWRHGGLWHRGLLTVQLDRLRLPAGLEEMGPWIDTAHCEVPGREALRWALGLTPGLNHLILALRRPLSARMLLTQLSEAPACLLLRTLTVRWAPGMGRRTEEGPVINLPEDFFARLVQLPVGQHLTHLGSTSRFSDGQAAVLRAAGVEPVLAQQPDWPHTLPPGSFRR